MADEKRTANPRSRARSWTLQILYAWETRADVSSGERASAAGGASNGRGASLRDTAERVLAERRVAVRYLPHIRCLVEEIATRFDEIDALLGRHIPNWRIERLAVLDRNILRIAAAELLAIREVPPRVAVHEAIRLAERYGSERSPRFVNGVLDAVRADVRPR